MSTTCQICGRAIKAAKGTIAHHGYKRPGHGWQTASCFGAHYRPYEISCDAISKAIASAERELERTAEKHLALFYFPPEKLFHVRTQGYPLVEKARPSGFDPFKLGIDVNMYGSYAYNWNRIEHDLRQTQRQIHEYIDFLRARLASWKAAA